MLENWTNCYLGIYCYYSYATQAHPHNTLHLDVQAVVLLILLYFTNVKQIQMVLITMMAMFHET